MIKKYVMKMKNKKFNIKIFLVIYLVLDIKKYRCV